LRTTSPASFARSAGRIFIWALTIGISDSQSSTTGQRLTGRGYLVTNSAGSSGTSWSLFSGDSIFQATIPAIRTKTPLGGDGAVRSEATFSVQRHFTKAGL